MEIDGKIPKYGKMEENDNDTSREGRHLGVNTGRDPKIRFLSHEMIFQNSMWLPKFTLHLFISVKCWHPSFF